MNVVVWILVAVVVVAALAFLLSRKPTLPAPKDETPPGAGDASASPAELARGAAREGSGASAELVPQASAKASAVPEAAEAAPRGEAELRLLRTRAPRRVGGVSQPAAGACCLTQRAGRAGGRRGEALASPQGWRG